MQTYSVDILHPKAVRLLEDLADLKLILLKKEKAGETKKETTDLRKLLLKGPTWSEDDYQEYLKTRESINKTGQK